MKKTFKFKRWMAFLLAVVLIGTTCISSSDAFLWATGEEEVTSAGAPEGGEAAFSTVAMDVQEEQPADNTYAWSVYFYYGEAEGNLIQGKGMPGDLILKDIPVEATAVYEGQTYEWVETVGADKTISTNEQENVVKVRYALPEAPETPEEPEAPEMPAYSLTFQNDSRKGTVEILSVNGGTVENAYTKGTEVAFEVSANEGYEVASVTADSETLKKTSEKKEDYTVTVEKATTVVVTYDETESEPETIAPVSKIKANAKNRAGSGNVSTTYTIELILNEGDGNKKLDTLTISGEAVEQRNVMTDGGETGMYSVVDAAKVANRYLKVTLNGKVYSGKENSYFIPGKKGSADNGKSYPYLVLQEEASQNVIQLFYISSEEVKKTVKIHFDLQGGNSNSMTVFEGTPGTGVVGGLPDASREGYDFDGWYTAADGGSKLSTMPGTYPEEDGTYYAHWKETVKAGKVIYDGNGASGSVASQEAKIGDTVSIAGGDGMTKEGYSFAGWSVDKEESGTWLNPGESYKVEQEEITLYAQWKPESVSYTVHYYLKGSSEKVKEDKVESYQNYGASITESAPSIDGYTVEGSGTATITLDAAAANVITFYYTKDANPSLEVTKVVQGKTTGYQPGDKVTYKITVKNTGDVLLTEVTVKDELTGDSKVYTDFGIGHEESFDTVYTVEEQDVAFGKVTNKVNASAKIGDKEVAHGSAVATIETVEKKSHLTLYKAATSSPKNGVAYDVGETITYTIKAENDGNQTLKNVIIEDTLTGKGQPITEIKPGEVAYLTTSYVVTEADRKNGEVINIVTAAVEGLSPEDVTPGSATVPTVKSEPALSIEKKAIGNTGGREYWLNEKVTYTITVKNTGNVTTRSDRSDANTWTDRPDTYTWANSSDTDT